MLGICLLTQNRAFLSSIPEVLNIRPIVYLTLGKIKDSTQVFLSSGCQSRTKRTPYKINSHVDKVRETI
jgi:hypothetical protein